MFKLKPTPIVKLAEPKIASWLSKIAKQFVFTICLRTQRRLSQGLPLGFYLYSNKYISY